MDIPLAKPYISQSVTELVQKAITGSQLSMGPFLKGFEEKFRQTVKAQYAVGVSSGTAALHLAIRLLDIGAEDEVITSPYSFIASSNCILFEGATPVFVDIEEETMGLDPSKVERAITSRTKAIVAVHVYGKSCQIKELRRICDRYDLFLIEDCCEALGAKHQGQEVGSYGDIACYGFYPNKHITTGEGGMLTTNQEEFALKARSLRNQGRSQNKEVLQYEELGYNYRLSEVSAAMGLGQMEEWERILDMRTQVLKWYQQLSSHQFNTSFFNPKVDSPFSMVIRVEKDREALISHLKEFGVQSKPYFDPPIHLLHFYKKRFSFRKGDFAITEKVSSKMLSLPFYTTMTRAEVAKVCEVLSRY